MQAFEERSHAVCLLGLTGELAGRRFLVRAGSVLGRSASATVFLPDPKLQRSHCRLVGAAGGLRLEPCGRSAPLAVNGQARQTHVLALGDTVRIGRFELRVELARPEVEPSNAPRGEAAPAPSARRPNAPRPERRSVPMHGQGAVLTLQWRSLPPSVAPAEMLHRLRRLVDRQVEASGGRWFVGDPTCPKIAWPAARGDTRFLAADTAFSIAARIQWAAFLMQKGQAAGICSIGWSEGELAWTKAGLFWGAAVDQALHLALEGDGGAIWRAGPLGTVPVRGIAEPTRGRRTKHVLACPVILWRDGEIADRAILRSAAWDPVTGLATVSLLSRVALEPEACYRIEATDTPGAGIPATVVASSPLNNRLGNRARLLGDVALAHLVATFGAGWLEETDALTPRAA